MAMRHLRITGGKYGTASKWGSPQDTMGDAQLGHRTAINRGQVLSGNMVQQTGSPGAARQTVGTVQDDRGNPETTRREDTGPYVQDNSHRAAEGNTDTGSF